MTDNDDPTPAAATASEDPAEALMRDRPLVFAADEAQQWAAMDPEQVRQLLRQVACGHDPQMVLVDGRGMADFPLTQTGNGKSSCFSKAVIDEALARIQHITTDRRAGR